MPRLEGKRSNTGLYIVLIIVILLVVLLVLNYLGYIHLIPGFGSA
jgi:hypothetical protein